MTNATKGPVLVTGASGFLGTWLIARLLNDGYRVAAFDILEDRKLLTDLVGEDRSSAVEWTVGDITDAASVEAAFERSQSREVAHLAALTIPACRKDPARGVLVNVLGHVNVLEAARKRGLAKILYTSSIAAHPRGALASPANIYGVTKRADEDISKVYYMDHGLVSVGLRPNVVYGYGRSVGETAAITEAIRAAAEGREYAMPFAGSLCLQYVAEIVDVMSRCLAASPSAPVVSDITTAAESIDDLIAGIRAIDPSARVLPSDRVRPAPDLRLDNGPLRQLIGDWKHVPLRDGIAETFRDYRRRAA